MNRRRFLTSLATGTTVLAVPAVVSAKSEQVVEYARNTTGLIWSGWTKPDNMNLVFGYWAVKVTPLPDGMGRDCLVSTTLGDVHRYRLDDQIYLSRAREWPQITIFSTDAEKEAVKQRALEALCQAMT